MEKVVTQPAFAMFRPVKLQAPFSRPESTEGFPFEFELGKIMMQKLGSSVEGFRNPTTQKNTPKSMEEVTAKVLQADQIIELFQTMAIVNLNMGNLILEVNNLNNKLAIR